MPKVPQILKIDPPEALSFKGPFTEVVTSTLTLKNPSDSRIAFKVKTTAPKRYCVRPNSGVLNKDEMITVSVMLQPFEFDPAEKNKHKFMIQSLQMIGEIEEKDVWKDADQDKLMDTKLRVVFDSESTQPAATPSAPSQNDLDMAAGEPVQMTPHKVNLKATVSEEEYNKSKEENTRLTKEVSSLKDELQRLRQIAISDTMTSGSKTGGGDQSEGGPTGLGLIFHDKTVLLVLAILFIATFFAGGLLPLLR